MSARARRSGAAVAPLIALDVRAEAAVTPGVEARRRLVRRLGRAMAAAGAAGAEVSLSLVDDPEIRALHHQFLGEDKPTDVLSFSQREGESPLVPAGAPELLGDIVISVETAARQAAGRGAALDDELLHLAVHGLAHLLGLDHATPEDERSMFGWEAQLREQALARAAVRAIPPPRQ